MRYVLLAAVLLTATVPALASSQNDFVGARSTRSCHCDRYSDPHYSRYVPRTGGYRGGRSTRY